MKNEKETIPSLFLGERDIGAISDKLSEILDILEKDPVRRAALAATPGKIAESWREIFGGIAKDPAAELRNKYKAVSADPVALRDIAFTSMCEHHFLPFFGTIDIAYRPRDLIAGFGAIIRLAEVYAKRPQIQERLTVEIADKLYEELRPAGLLVRIRARHLCMTMIGGKKSESAVATEACRGEYADLRGLLGN